MSLISNSSESQSLYVPNPDLWVKFYSDVAKGHIPPNSAISSMGRRHKPGNIKHASPLNLQKNIDAAANRREGVTIISPSEQVVEQAKSEIERKPEEVSLVAMPKMRKKTRKTQVGGSRKGSGGRSRSVSKKSAKRKSRGGLLAKTRKRISRKRLLFPEIFGK